jgi:beta-aspartyl-peptidase (threonine type)
MVGFLVVAAITLPASGPDTSVDKAVRAVLEAQAVAWNKGDLEGFMEGYWRSPKLSFSSGSEVTRGWDETLARYKKKYQSGGAEMGKLTFSNLEVEPLAPDAALVRGRWQLVRTKDKPGGVFTLVFRKFAEGWRIVHDHTSGS